MDCWGMLLAIHAPTIHYPQALKSLNINLLDTIMFLIYE